MGRGLRDLSRGGERSGGKAEVVGKRLSQPMLASAAAGTPAGCEEGTHARLAGPTDGSCRILSVRLYIYIYIYIYIYMFPAPFYVRPTCSTVGTHLDACRVLAKRQPAAGARYREVQRFTQRERVWRTYIYYLVIEPILVVALCDCARWLRLSLRAKRLG